MYTYLEFRAQGHVGSVREVGKTLKINVASNERWKNRETGEQQEKTSWITVTVFERMPGFAWVKENLREGDLVYITGKIENTKYEKNGEAFYDTTLIADAVNVVPTGRGD